MPTIFEEMASAGRWDRPELSRLLDQLRKDDVLIEKQLQSQMQVVKIALIQPSSSKSNSNDENQKQKALFVKNLVEKPEKQTKLLRFRQIKQVQLELILNLYFSLNCIYIRFNKWNFIYIISIIRIAI